MGDVGLARMIGGFGSDKAMLRNITAAEAVADNVLSKVHPTALSEKRRREVIHYIQNLIKWNLGCEVLPYGSVPLRTYLPDGDIDLTAFVGHNLEENLANDVVSILQSEEQNNSAEFIVKDVQLIRAEVKIVKCIVQNIVVDISFNQLGGLCTLCFLEKVNRVIGKDHLFKRSIILVKAWCYYESRILGAHHALISTYALETLVLYIFHLFHSKLDGPLAVLHKFLDYFSKFDWDTYCIGLNGPVRLSSLPEIVDEKHENGEGALLLSDEFLKECLDMFSVPSKLVGKNPQTFFPKHLNIIDPLKANNNLGRSVSKGNLFRIRSAFAYGAKKLGQALSQGEDKLAEELSNFFSNTMDRHGYEQRPDVQDLIGSFSQALSFSEPNSYKAVATTATSLSTNDDDTSEEMGPGFPPCAPHMYITKSKGKSNSSGKRSSNEPKASSSLSSSSNQQSLPVVKTNEVGSYKSSLCDLNGEYEGHLNAMKYGRFCYDHFSAMPAQPQTLPSQWDVIRHAIPYKRNGFSNMHKDNVGMIPRPGFYHNNPMVLMHPPGPVSFGVEDFPKQRGTGTYIPKANRPPYQNRPPMMRPHHHSPHYTSPFTPFRKIEMVMNSSDVAPNAPRHHVPESSITRAQQIAPSVQILPSPPPPPPPPSAPEDLQSSSPAFHASSMDTRLLMENSDYQLKDEDDFPPLSM